MCAGACRLILANTGGGGQPEGGCGSSRRGRCAGTLVGLKRRPRDTAEFSACVGAGGGNTYRRQKDVKEHDGWDTSGAPLGASAARRGAEQGKRARLVVLTEADSKHTRTRPTDQEPAQEAPKHASNAQPKGPPLHSTQDHAAVQSCRLHGGALVQRPPTAHAKGPRTTKRLAGCWPQHAHREAGMETRQASLPTPAQHPCS